MNFLVRPKTLIRNFELEGMLKINLCSFTRHFIQHKDVHSYDTRKKNDNHFNHISTITVGTETVSYKTGTYWNNLT